MINYQFYTNVQKQPKHGKPFEYYEVFYKLSLPDGVYAESWDPILKEVSRNVYEIDNLADQPTPQHHIIKLLTNNSINDHRVALEGKIIVKNIPEITNRWHPLAFTLKVKMGGNIMGDGSTIHYGDAD